MGRDRIPRRLLLLLAARLVDRSHLQLLDAGFGANGPGSTPRGPGLLILMLCWLAAPAPPGDQPWCGNRRQGRSIRSVSRAVGSTASLEPPAPLPSSVPPDFSKFTSKRLRRLYLVSSVGAVLSLWLNLVEQGEVGP